MARRSLGEERWAALVPIREGEQAELGRALGEALGQLPPPTDVVLVDSTLDGIDAVLPPGVHLVRELSPSRGLAWRHGAAHTEAAWIALFAPRSRYSRHRVARQLAAVREETRLVTCDVEVATDAGATEPLRQLEPSRGPTPVGAFEDGLLLHRSVAAALPTACFAPTELALVRQHRRAGTAAHAAHALHTVSRAALDAAVARTREDARLLELGHGAPRPPRTDPPEVTVLLATHERRDVLLECLEGFSRQDVPPGTLELVVVDDASLDGTVELGAALELPVPLHFESLPEPGGATQARIHALPHARGRLVLFVNDDTIPRPDTVRRHMEAHAELASDRAMVLGTFEQPDEHRDLALTRLVDAGSIVFDYASWKPGQRIPGSAFYTCNLSAPLAAIRAAGGFDPEFSMYAEDTDLGLRLEELGYELYYRPECRALHRHLYDFDWLRRRQPLVGVAHTKLFAKHPERLLGTGWAELGRRKTRAVTGAVSELLPTIHAAARTLSTLEASAFDGASPSLAACLAAGERELGELVARLNTVWWYEGFERGFEASGGRDLLDLTTAWCPLPAPESRSLHLLRADGPRWPTLARAWLRERRRAPDDATGEVLALFCEGTDTATITETRRQLGAILRRARRAGLDAPILLTRCDAGASDALFEAAASWSACGEASDAVDTERARTHGCRARVLAPTADPFPPAELRLLAWPSWDEEACAAQLASLLEPLAHAPHAQAVLLYRRAEEPRVSPTLAALPRAARPRIVFEAPADAAGWSELADHVDVTAYDPALPRPTDRLLKELELPSVATPADLATELLAREGAALPPVHDLPSLAHA